MTVQDLFRALGEEVDDPEEETFLLFSQSTPSQNLGFIDARAAEIEITVRGKDLNIRQSPGLLSSNREGGTTGAVVWKITPLFAEWIASDNNVLFRTAAFDQSSEVLELGCGVSGIVAITLGPKIGRYIATDQDYVFKLLKSNIGSNTLHEKPISSTKAKRRGAKTITSESGSSSADIKVIALDWEVSSVSNLSILVGHDLDDKVHNLDAVIACDCIYNEALVDPFVQSCTEACRLVKAAPGVHPTLCIIAQQLRSASVFEAWLEAFHKIFRVWRMPDELLIEALREHSGFVVHLGVLRETDIGNLAYHDARGMKHI